MLLSKSFFGSLIVWCGGVVRVCSPLLEVDVNPYASHPAVRRLCFCYNPMVNEFDYHKVLGQQVCGLPRMPLCRCSCIHALELS